MIGLLTTVVSFIIAISILVFIHEMGHFLVARFFNVKVSAFSIGFGPEIVAWEDKHGVRWRLAWVPLGGYVKFAGDENAASVPSKEQLDEMRAAGADPNIFHFKPVWQRALVVFAGPAANFLLAILIFALLSMFVGLRFTTPRIDGVALDSPAAEAGILAGDVVTRMNSRSVDRFETVREIERFNAGREITMTLDRQGREVVVTVTPRTIEVPDPLGGSGTQPVGDLGIFPRSEMALVGLVDEGSPAAEAGLQVGDLITHLDGREIVGFMDLVRIVSASPGKPLEIIVLRNGAPVTLTVTPAPVEGRGADGEPATIGRIGIARGFSEEDTVRVRYGPLSGLAHGTERTASIITQTLSYIGGIFAGTQSADQLGGPLRIAQISGQAASVSIVAFITLLAFLSVSIGLINLFPVPMLDGGHLVFYAYEAIAGRPLGPRAQEIGFQIGLFLVLSLMIFATWNDLMHFDVFNSE